LSDWLKTLILPHWLVLMSGILSAIAAPGWFAFTNRQRVNKANDAVWGSLQQAQREAKRTKLSYSVSFIQNPVPQFVVYPANQTGSCTPAPIPALSDPRWTNLGDSTLKPGQVWLYTNIANNIANSCTTSNQVDTSGTSLTATAKTITFDYTGALPPTSKTGLKVVVAQAKPGNSPPPTLDPSVLKRCVIVQTLIGGIQTSTDPNVCN